MQHIARTSSRLFALPDYERAQFNIFNSAVNLLMKAKDPVFAQIPESEPTEMLPVTQNTMPSGETVTSEPVLIETKIVFQWDYIRKCNLDAFANQVDNTAEARLSIVMPHLFALTGKLCEAAGTATDMAGAPLTFESFLAAFSKMELRFEQDGAPVIPELVVSPETARVLAKLPPWTAEQQERWELMIEEKRKAYFANRRHRKLS